MSDGTHFYVDARLGRGGRAAHPLLALLRLHVGPPHHGPAGPRGYQQSVGHRLRRLLTLVHGPAGADPVAADDAQADRAAANGSKPADQPGDQPACRRGDPRRRNRRTFEAADLDRSAPTGSTALRRSPRRIAVSGAADNVAKASGGALRRRLPRRASRSSVARSFRAARGRSRRARRRIWPARAALATASSIPPKPSTRPSWRAVPPSHTRPWAIRSMSAGVLRRDCRDDAEEACGRCCRPRPGSARPLRATAR